MVLDPVQKVTLASSNLSKSIGKCVAKITRFTHPLISVYLDYWTNIAGMKIFEQSSNNVVLGYAENQAKLGLHAIEGSVEHEKAFGRIAIACPRAEVNKAICRFLRKSQCFVYCRLRIFNLVEQLKFA